MAISRVTRSSSVCVKLTRTEACCGNTDFPQGCDCEAFVPWEDGATQGGPGCEQGGLGSPQPLQDSACPSLRQELGVASSSRPAEPSVGLYQMCQLPTIKSEYAKDKKWKSVPLNLLCREHSVRNVNQQKLLSSTEKSADWHLNFTDNEIFGEVLIFQSFQELYKRSLPLPSPSRQCSYFLSSSLPFAL